MPKKLKSPCLAALVWTTSLSLAGCNDAGGAATPTDGHVAGMPSLYVDTIEEMIEDGQNVMQKNYFDFLKVCQAAGSPIKPLSDAEIELVGTTRVQRWYDEGVEAFRHERWHWEIEEVTTSNTCFFKLIHTGHHKESTPRQTASTDVATGETYTEPFPAEEAFNRPAYEAEPDLVASYRGLGFEGPVSTRVAGQPCTQWVTPQGEKICLWSGGAQRGIPDAPVPDGCQPELGIVLASEPADGTGCRVTTKHFTLGQPLDPGAYQSAQSR